MTKPQQYYLAGRFFDSKAAVTRAVRTELLQYNWWDQFTSPLLADLLSHYHHALPRLGLVPLKFRKTPPLESNRLEDYNFEAYFDDPRIGGWHGVSWVKCLRPSTYFDEVREFLRRTIAPAMASQRGLRCESCGSNQNLEVDHASPAFQEIFLEAVKQFTMAEIDGWAYHDWIGEERFKLPRDHPVTQSFLTLHAGAVLQTLCRTCHIQKTNGRQMP
jgi:hypothetical protein